MKMWCAALLLALGTGVASPAWAGDQSKEQNAKKADAERRERLRMQRNQRILTQEEIERAIAPHVPDILACYKEHAAKQKKATGEIQLEILIRPEGFVHRLWVVAKGVKGQGLNDCVKKLATTWEFPKKPGFTNAIVPFYFQKTNAKGTGPLESCWNPKGCPDKKRRKTK